MNAPSLLDLTKTFVALDDEGGARPLPVTDAFWGELMSGKLGPVPRMVSLIYMAADWTTWERHPAGDELVCLLDGEVTFICDGADANKVMNRPGHCILIPANTWHTAKVTRPGNVLFITPGEGTEHKPV